MKQQEIPERVLRILAVLREKLDRATTTPAEAEQAALKIRELLMKHNLSMSDIDEFGKKREEKVGHTFISMDEYQDKNGANWAMFLLTVVCKYNLCKAIMIHKGGEKTCSAILVGESQNIQLVMYSFQVLVRMIKEAESYNWKMYQGQITNRNTYKRGFYKGCVDGIFRKLKAQSEGEDNNTPSIEGEQITALVRRTDVAITDYVNKTFGGTVQGGSGWVLSGRDGYRDGLKASQRMGVNKAIN